MRLLHSFVINRFEIEVSKVGVSGYSFDEGLAVGREVVGGGEAAIIALVGDLCVDDDGVAAPLPFGADQDEGGLVQDGFEGGLGAAQFEGVKVPLLAVVTGRGKVDGEVVADLGNDLGLRAGCGRWAECAEYGVEIPGAAKVELRCGG